MLLGSKTFLQVHHHLLVYGPVHRSQLYFEGIHRFSALVTLALLDLLYKLFYGLLIGFFISLQQ